MKLNVNTQFIGKNCIYYKTIDSTQLEIWRLAKTNIPTGTIVIADLQTSGIGIQMKKTILHFLYT